jgi:ligand-binding sensor domain-containing protein
MGIIDNNPAGLSYFNGSNWVNFNRYNSLYPGNVVTDLIIDKKNKIWIASNAGLVSYDRKKWKIYNTSNSGLKSNNIVSVSIDSDQNKWCSNVGISEYIGGK